ncbi:PREDICTED: NACHT, LRR and PYD domains-containing protein 10 [Elephantulus edwardii]|uniref:NACHT, LRR and PYD domains-containing protein 10 n=1 Tax=Elephantulus edwardii TaxID=28737 RepID=UPI0003F063CC|nr:PREDICTED: NACHT, LRR and PYD domains-containing protein 10 [Elephantulus edwardii]
MTLSRGPEETLLFALNDLEDESFKTLKFHLRIMTPRDGHQQLTRGELQDLKRVELASRLIQIYGAYEAVKIVLESLKKMNLLELVGQLSLVCLNDYREKYREHVRCLEEKQEVGINGSYNHLLLVSGSSSGSPEVSTCPTLEQELVLVEDLFGSGERHHTSTVVLQGLAGTGKTTLARKMVLDWARGTLFMGRFDYVFYVSCREVVLLRGCKLEQLLCWCCGDNQAPVEEILRHPERLLFILDGFDELQKSFAEQLMKSSLSSKECELHLLIKRTILCKSSLFITIRPLALQNLRGLLKKPRYVHILGFSEEEKRRYFSFYFTDEEQARNAFDIVQRYKVLHKECQVPGICWMVCSWIKRQMERGREISNIFRNSTDIYMAYVSTFLPPNDDGDGLNLPRYSALTGLCTLATEGIQKQQFLFEEADLRKHNLDGPWLADFLSSIDYHEGFAVKRFYSFRHISFQEFFHAISYLVKEEHNQLGQESHSELKRLLDTKSDDRTLDVRFLLEILKNGETASILELKLCFKISSTITQNLKDLKKQLESMRHSRPWNLEFSLNGSKIKDLKNSVQMSEASFSWKNKNVSQGSKGRSFSVKTSLRNEQEEEEKSHPMDKENEAGTQNETSNGKDRDTRDKRVMSSWVEKCVNGNNRDEVAEECWVTETGTLGKARQSKKDRSNKTDNGF